MDTMTEIDRPTDSPISASPGTDYRDYVNSILEYIAACHRQADLDPKAKQHLTKIAGYLLDMIDRLEPTRRRSIQTTYCGASGPRVASTNPRLTAAGHNSQQTHRAIFILLQTPR